MVANPVAVLVGLILHKYIDHWEGISEKVTIEEDKMSDKTPFLYSLSIFWLFWLFDIIQHNCVSNDESIFSCVDGFI